MARAAASRVTKKKLSVAQAADQWEAAKRAIEKQKALLEEAAPILKAHLEKTGRKTYKDRIALITTPAKLILDQPKVREFLGKRLGEFQKRTEPSTSLTLLEK
ncbi:MAG: hypothetical protein QOG35_1617 [Solirubrobacteraceae bacterium]|jgi:hypothetical protein|nr:hypothetical protein [Solirubrobacteraceae bacterium]